MTGVKVMLPSEDVLLGEDSEICEDPISIAGHCDKQRKVELDAKDKNGEGAFGEEAQVSDIQCELCNYVTNQARNLKIHKKFVHKELPEKNTDVLRKKKNVVTMEHPVGGRIQCPQCPATFSKKQGTASLNRHIQSIHSKLRYTCDMCGKTFGRKDSLRIHKGRCHTNNVDEEGSKLKQGSLRKLEVEKGIGNQSPEIICIDEIQVNKEHEDLEEKPDRNSPKSPKVEEMTSDQSPEIICIEEIHKSDVNVHDIIEID